MFSNSGVHTHVYMCIHHAFRTLTYKALVDYFFVVTYKPFHTYKKGKYAADAIHNYTYALISVLNPI